MMGLLWNLPSGASGNLSRCMIYREGGGGLKSVHMGRAIVDCGADC